MKRQIENGLLAWKTSPHRKPLILSGARQVGKTYAVKKFGEDHFAKTHYLNFEKDKRISAIFKIDFDPNRIIRELELSLGKRIRLGYDLLIFDEIQECPEALTSLKYFQEELTDLHLIAAGSLLGIYLGEGSFPVGKVDRLWMGPLSFSEFLFGTASEMEAEYLEEAFLNKKVSPFVHERLLEKFRTFCVTGGMPAVVNAFNENRSNIIESFESVRKTQEILMKDYLDDISKHAGKINSIHIRSVLENVPIQLGKNLDDGVKKYIFKDVLASKKGYAELQGPLSWLQKIGLIQLIKISNKPEMPIEAFCKDSVFKVYFFDIGLLGAMFDISPNLLYQQNYGQTKGVYLENVVLQLINSNPKSSTIYSWQQNTSEIEFISRFNDNIIPIEVKSGINTKAKSLQSYINRYQPSFSILISNQILSYDEQKQTWHIPCYMSEGLDRIVG